MCTRSEFVWRSGDNMWSSLSTVLIFNWTQVHHAGQQAFTPEISCWHIVPLSQPEAPPFDYTVVQQASTYLCLPVRRLRVHTTVSGFPKGSGDPSFMYVWQTLYLLCPLPSPAETKLKIQICMPHIRSFYYRETLKSEMKAGSLPSSVPAAMGT